MENTEVGKRDNVVWAEEPRAPKVPNRNWIGRVNSRDTTAANHRDFRDWCVRLAPSGGDHRDISFSHCSRIRSGSFRLQSLYCSEWRATLRPQKLGTPLIRGYHFGSFGSPWQHSFGASHLWLPSG